jgi:hypothetical protein
MKSIMEEASTIFKAIEKAWIRAEKPQSFSVKLLEEPTKNFIGMTVKPAKIAFLFEETAASRTPHKQQNASTFAKAPATARHSRSGDDVADRQPMRDRTENMPAQQGQQVKKTSPAPTQKHDRHRMAATQDHVKAPMDKHQQGQPKKRTENRPTQSAQQPVHGEHQPTAPATEQREKQQLIWHDTMARVAESWLKDTITVLGKTVPPFTTEIKNKHLIIAFETPIVEDAHQERMLFSSLAHLTLQVVRNQFKNQARGLKIILKTNS